MKNLLSILLFITFLISLSACSVNNTTPTYGIQTTPTTTQSTNDDIINDEQSYEEPENDISIESLILGEWYLESQTYSNGKTSTWNLQTIKLYTDGTCAVNGEIGTWKLVEDELMLLGSYGGRFWGADAIVGRFSCDGKSLEFHGAQIDGKNNSVNLKYRKAG